MTETNPIPGYRVTGSRNTDRLTSFEYLKQTPAAAKLLSKLRSAALSEGASCLNDGRYTSDDLPTDREAALMCSLCPVFEPCEVYTAVARPAWGVWAGVVKGRELQKAMEGE